MRWERALGGHVVHVNERWYRVRKIYPVQGSPWAVETRQEGEPWQHLEHRASLTSGKRLVQEREGRS